MAGDIPIKVLVVRMTLNGRNGSAQRRSVCGHTPNSVTVASTTCTRAGASKLIQTPELLHVISLMVTPSPMDTTTTPAANSDLDIRISRIADPNIGMTLILS